MKKDLPVLEILLVATLWGVMLNYLAFGDPIPPMVIQSYVNPIEVPMADPQIGFFNGTYYLTGTSYDRQISKDLIHWQHTKTLYFEASNAPWIADYVWGAEIHERSGKYYWYFCVPGTDTAGNRQICVATAASPTNAFSVAAVPIWKNPSMPYIDPSVFVDDDGSAYLYLTHDMNSGTNSAKIVVARLSNNMTNVLSTNFTTCIQPSQLGWEWWWQEGVTVIKRSGVYYMTWSSKYYASKEYGVGFATATNPMGPWTKSRHNPILQWASLPEGLVSGPGHNGFVSSPDSNELFMVYHSHIGTNADGYRHMNLDRVTFEPDPGYPDKMVVQGPTMSPQTLPSGSTPLVQTFDRDEFTGTSLDNTRWPIIWYSVPWFVWPSGGKLLVFPQPGNITIKTNGSTTPWLWNVILQYAPKVPFYHFDAKPEINTGSSTNAYAYLIAWDSPRNHLMARYFRNGMLQIEKTVNGIPNLLSQTQMNTNAEMRLTQMNGSWRVSIGSNQSWTHAGSPVANFFPQNRPVKIGFGAGTFNTNRETNAVRFDWVECTSFAPPIVTGIPKSLTTNTPFTIQAKVDKNFGYVSTNSLSGPYFSFPPSGTNISISQTTKLWYFGMDMMGYSSATNAVLYQIAPKSPYAADLSGAFAVGSPYSGSGPGITFAKVTAKTTVRIFSVSGKSVREVKAGPGDAPGTILWPVTQSGGKKVPAGVYVCILTDPSVERKIIKVIVQP